MSTDQFHNKDGSLTAYALACGYIQVSLTGPIVDDGMSTFEAPAEVHRYSVRLSAAGNCYDIAVRDVNLSSGLAAWHQFDTLTQARRAYRRAVRHYSALTADTPATPRDMSPYAAPPTWSL